MKKKLTIDDFIVAFISAIGYGLSFEIPKILGWEMWQCVIFCTVAGGTLDLVARKIVFSQSVQNNAVTKKLIVFAFFLVFLVGQYIALKLTGLSMYDYLFEQYLYIILPAVLGFALSMAVRWYRFRQVRKRYGEGNKGFLFDDVLKPDEVENWNKKNQPIKGEYDKKFAVKTKTGIYVGYKEKNVSFMKAYPLQSRLSANFAGKLPNRCPNQTKFLRQNISAHLPYRLNTKVQS